ncbi:hypothetical protein RQM59_12085 [Flavobacteriaceae bacterium S356]|uniref:Uncharacterized protein n=1 Tax=Asprobacillus argus TaxID=3076534 RepID=A0ABU3LHD6_9FLAO|nr:hypothetical protein [Flavobacteriaceae bacterium S356]
MAIKDLQNCKVEDFAHLIINKKETFQSLKSKVHHSDLPETLRKKIMQRLAYAKERVEKPLDLDQTILFIFFPFGVINRFSQGTFFDVQRELYLGYIKKVKEYRMYSLLGIAFYFAIILMIIFIR